MTFAIIETAIGVALGLTIIGGLAVVALPQLKEMMQKQGLFAYNGLTREHVIGVYKAMDARCKILSRVCGSHGTGHGFCRGIYLGGAATFPLYYRYEYFPDGRATYDLYPMVAERWSTDPDLTGSTGKIQYPIPYKSDLIY